MKFSVPTILLALWGSLVATAPAPAPDTDIDPSKAHIDAINYAGSGCKAGSVAISPSTDWRTITLAFDDYVASIGPGTKFTDRRKNCNINFRVHYPQGWQFTLHQTTYKGYAELQKGVKGSQTSWYWFADSNQSPVTFKSQWVGPYKENYDFTDNIVAESWAWSPCGTSSNLNINTELLLNNDGASGNSGMLTTDVVDHKVRHICGITWRKCP